MKYILLVSILSLLNIMSFSQNWSTTGGNNQRNGLTKMTGPQSTASPIWTVNSISSIWGNSVFTYGDRFITSRVSFSPIYHAIVECRKLSDGSLLWDNQVTDTSIMYAVGMNEFAAYAHDYKTGLLYALSLKDGSVLWSIIEDMFGGKGGILFTDNGDPVIKGKRLDKFTGDVIWNYNYIIPVGPDAGYAIYDSTYYHWTGSIVTPKKVFALDAETGQLKYESVELPGDGDQEIPLTIGSDGTIYIPRDGGLLYAIGDDGSSLRIKWEYDPSDTIKGYFGSDIDGNIYAVDGDRIIRLNKDNGVLIDSSIVPVAAGFLPLITVDAEEKVYLCNAEAGAGRYYCFSKDLQTVIWEMALPYNYYCGPSIGKDGIMVLIGGGLEIKAFKTDSLLKPAADFFADTIIIYNGETIDFFDQSSYSPDNWEWLFPGGEPSSSTDKDPQGITYPSQGVYDVTLISSNVLGTDTLLKRGYIIVQEGLSTEDENIRPKDFLLSQNYPNPFNPVTKIKYQIPSMVHVTIDVYDVLGNKIKSLVNEDKPAGMYEIEFNGKDLSSGIYYYKMQAGEYNTTKKLVLMK